MPLTTSDGTVLRTRKCAVCKMPMCVRRDYYYCPNKECARFDLLQRVIGSKDVLRQGAPPSGKPRVLIGTGCDVTVRRTPCAHCGQVVYHVTTDGAEVVVCKCGVVVRGR